MKPSEVRREMDDASFLCRVAVAEEMPDRAHREAVMAAHAAHCWMRMFGRHLEQDDAPVTAVTR